MKRAAPLVLLLFTLSGVSGLVYEIVWIRMLSHLLGGTSYAISTVLAAFMAGLALGSRYFGRRADSVQHPLRLYARLEFGIAAFGALVYLLIRAAPPAYVAIAGALPEPVLVVLRVVIAGVLLLPPTFLMGGTLPVLSRFIVRSHDRLGRGVGLLYAVNTLGAVAGCFLTGYVFIMNLGIAGSTALAIIINGLVGAAIWLIDRSVESVPAAPAQANRVARDTDSVDRKARRGKDPADMRYSLLAVIIALSGFASLGYELYWTRALQHFLGNSTYSFSAMLTTFLLGLAGGAWVGGWLADRVRSPARLLGWVQVLVGVFALSTILLIWDWLPRLETTQWLGSQNITWTAYILRRFAVAFAVMILPTFFTGMTFPIANRIGIRSLDRVAQGVGSLYYANTVGAILGSLAAGFLILPLLGAKSALVATGILSVALGLTAHIGNLRRVIYEPFAAAALLMLLCFAGPRLTAAGSAILSDSQEAGDMVLLDTEDHTGETRVYRKPNGDLHMSVDGHHIGGTEAGIVRKEKVLAHLPMVLRPDARNCLVVGLGSGVTLGTLAQYEELEALHCVEIVPGVVDGARLFSKMNGFVLEDPRLHVKVGDGVQYLLTTRERFDIISSDSKLNPEYSGNAPLLALDYYEICRDRLTDNGVMVQWLAVHLPVSEIKIVLRSFIRAFPHVGVYWYNPYNIIFAGSKAPLVLDMDAARRFSARSQLSEDLAGLELDDPYVVATLWISGGDFLSEKVGDGLVNSWQRPVSEFTMGRRYLEKQRAYHEDDTLRWLMRIRHIQTQRLKGEYDQADYERYLESAGSLLDGYSLGGGIDRLDNGLQLFKDALEANPDDERLRQMVTALESMESDIDESLASGELDTPEMLVRAGLLRHNQGRYQESLDLFERAFAQRPDDPDIQYNRMLALKSLGRTAVFQTALSEFISSFPRDPRGYSLQGTQLASRGDFEGALTAFERSVELGPDSPAFLNNLATALARLDRFEEAARAFEAVCELRPQYQNAAFFAAASFSVAGLPQEAAKWARFCIDEGLTDATRFATDPMFDNLRDSEFWDPERAEPR